MKMLKDTEYAGLGLPSENAQMALHERKGPDYKESRHVTLDKDVLDRNRCVSISPDSPYLNAYKVLRSQIQKKIKDKGWSNIMVTSAVPGEGKTLTAINLAGAFAHGYQHTVLLIDCDLHRQDVHKILGVPNNKSLVDHLIDGVALKDLIIWPGIDKFTFISGDRTIPGNTELLASPGMESLAQEVKSRYRDRLVIYDSPPILSGIDAITFAQNVDCIIMVVNAGKTLMGDLKHALNLIPREKLLGLVLNGDENFSMGSYTYDN